METILHGLARREGLMLVTGDIGCGKTTLCRRLLSLLPPRTFISVILNPFLTAEDLLKQVLVDFGLVSNADIRGGALTNASCHDLVRTLHDFLGTLAQLECERRHHPGRSAGSHAAHDRADSAAVELRDRLGEAAADHSGRPDEPRSDPRARTVAAVRSAHLEDGAGSSRSGPAKSGRISPGASPLRSPIPIGRSWRAPPSEPATRSIRFRFRRAAVRAIARISGRVPRIINLLCDRALEQGGASGNVAHRRRHRGRGRARSEDRRATRRSQVVEQRRAARHSCRVGAVRRVDRGRASVTGSGRCRRAATELRARCRTAGAASPCRADAACGRRRAVDIVRTGSGIVQNGGAGTRRGRRRCSRAGIPRASCLRRSGSGSSSGPFDTLEPPEAARQALTALHFGDVGIRETR